MSTTDDGSNGLAVAVGESETAFLLKYLETHDAACPLCQYNLRGLTVARCPECGWEIRLAVGMAEPYLRALVTFLVAMCLSAGCGLFCFIEFATEFLRLGHWPRFGSFEWAEAFLCYATMASMVPTGLAVVLYRRMIRLPTAVQWSMAAMAMGWDVILVLVFAIIMR